LQWRARRDSNISFLPAPIEMGGEVGDKKKNQLGRGKKEL